MATNPTFGVRRFTPYRDDRRCFELYNIQTGECASFPGTKREIERYARQRNAEVSAEHDQRAEDESNYSRMIGESLKGR